MEKAIEIKRRAQRFVQSGDVEAALVEYEKLARAEEGEPYHSVVIADLLFKKGDSAAAANRYLTAVDGYERSGLYKNGIAVCKKMARLGLATGKVFKRLGQLHALDGLATESGLYFLQHAEFAVRAGNDEDAAVSLRLAFEASNENVIALERLAEIHVLNGERESAISVMKEAITQHDRRGQLADASRCEARLRQFDPAAADGLKNAPTADIAGAQSTALDDAPAVPLGLAYAAGINDIAEGQLELTRPEDDLRPEDGAPVVSLRFAPPAQFESLEREAANAHLGAPALDGGHEAESVALTVHARNLNGDEESQRSATADLESLAGMHPEFLADMAPPRPGLSFSESPRGAQDAGEELAAQPGEEWFQELLADAADDDTLLDLLHKAVESQRAVAPQEVAQLLVRLAQAHDAMGNAPAAANVYRAMSEHLEPVRPAMMLWFDNCRRRGDRTQGARVACDLGDDAQRRGDALAAREWFERAHALDPQLETATARVAALGGASAAVRAATVVVTEPVVEGRPARVAAPNAPLASTEDPLKIQVTHGFGDHVTMDLHELIETFQAAVQGQVSGDAESHYALGMSYMEMGLAQQAIESLRAAAQEPSLRARACELIGRCCMDQGRFDDATIEYRAALAQPDLAPDAALNVRFELGIGLEAAGKLEAALIEFEKIYTTQASFPDVALKIRVLRRTLETE